ncbi:unnamed protein product, partial [Choristocarpus tenellus]
ESIRQFKRAFDDVIWPNLVANHGWMREQGHRPNDNYFLPPGVTRGRGSKCRIHYFDSSKQVMLYIFQREEQYGELLQKAWEHAASIPKPIASSKGSSTKTRRQKRKSGISRRVST